MFPNPCWNALDFDKVEKIEKKKKKPFEHNPFQLVIGNNLCYGHSIRWKTEGLITAAFTLALLYNINNRRVWHLIFFFFFSG